MQLNVASKPCILMQNFQSFQMADGLTSDMDAELAPVSALPWNFVILTDHVKIGNI
jgi:hypothetical protein